MKEPSISESRDAATSSSYPHSPTQTQRRNDIPHHHPLASLRGQSAAFMNTRARAKSLGSEPLLIPQSPPANLRTLSLSPKKIPGAPSLLFGSSLSSPEPPRISEVQRAVEHAVQLERKRVKEMEPTELTMTADELRNVLKQERRRMSGFASELAKLKFAAVQCQAESEIHEERCINGLMRRLDSVQSEKERIIVELEREEEMLTNTLQKKLNQVRQEKAGLEKLIEKEKVEHRELEEKLSKLQGTITDEAKKDQSMTGCTFNDNGLAAFAEMPGEEGEDEVDEHWEIGEDLIPR